MCEREKEKEERVRKGRGKKRGRASASDARGEKMNQHNRVRDRHRRVRVDHFAVERAVRKSRVIESGLSKKKPREPESRRAMEERSGVRVKGLSKGGEGRVQGETSGRKRGQWAMRQLRRERPRDSSPSRVVNRCTRTGFARSTRRVGLSRFHRREQCRLGRLPGVMKASW